MSSAAPEIRQGMVSAALASFTTLNKVLPKLTEQEVHACLELEASTLRRRTVIDRLISRAVRLNELTYSSQLKEKFHGTHPVESPQRQGAEG